MASTHKDGPSRGTRPSAEIDVPETTHRSGGGLRTLDRGPEDRLRSDSVTGPLCPTSSSRLLGSPGAFLGETGRPSEPGPVTQSLHSRTSLSRSEGRPVSPHLLSFCWGGQDMKLRFGVGRDVPAVGARS